MPGSGARGGGGPGLPAGAPPTALPASVSVREVGPRDGFQNEPEVIATEHKVELIDALARSGLARIEATSFVRSETIPQLQDAEDVLSRIDVPAQTQLSVLIPNERGLERALALRERLSVERPGRRAFDAVNVFLSASETHNRKNVNRTIAESLEGLERVLAGAREAGLHCEGVISTAFGCPYEGRVDPARVLDIAERLCEGGAREIALADTTGMANPLQVQELFALARERLPGGPADPHRGADGAADGAAAVELTAHFHNTRGQGLANVLAALQSGVASFESSFGELGGCPVPAGATGNIATEDLASMLAEMGIRTGIDLDALIACSRRVQEILGRPLTSHTLVAGPVEWG
jgi:hydroxymethylglutaryl-CoA lyase